MMMLQPQTDLLRPQLIGSPSKLRPQLLEPFSSRWGLVLLGTNEYISIPTLTSPIPSSTIVAEVEFNSGDWRAIIGFHVTSVHSFQISTVGRILYGDMSGALVGSLPFAMPSGVVSSVAAIRNDTDINNAKIYVNAVDVTAGFAGSFYNPSWTNGRIGYRVDDLFPWLGLFKKIAVWGRALSLGELSNYLNGQVAANEIPGLLIWCRFQEGFGVADGTVIRDWSGQGNHGSMQNFSGDPWVNVGIR